MGNTFFYKKVKDNDITWKDIFSESFKKHSKSEAYRALMAGTSLNKVNEGNMLAKWEKPWLWFQALKIFLVITVIIWAAYLIPYNAVGTTALALQYTAIFIPPLFMPLVILIFIWELNIPKNVTFLECIMFWLIGGMLSLMVGIMLSLVIMSAPKYATLAEEPAKLIVSIAILLLLSRKRKIYGVTGLLIGACVGAGFGGFESAQYAFNYSEGDAVNFYLILRRTLWAWGGHTLYCAPMVGAVALNMDNSKLELKSICNMEFVVSYLFASFMHYCWNNNFLIQSETVAYAKNVLIVVLLWVLFLWITRKCLNQVVQIGKYSHSAYVNEHSFTGMYAQNIRIVGTGGALRGSSWFSDGAMDISIGRSSENVVSLPGSTKGVSRKHCRIAYDNGVWKLTDLNSSNGTYINGRRLKPGAVYSLKPGDVIQLANTNNTFKALIE